MLRQAKAMGENRESRGSVLDQKISAVELLVMDPGSSDGSRELLNRLKQEYGDRLVLYCEADHGDWCGNADDQALSLLHNFSYVAFRSVLHQNSRLDRSTEISQPGECPDEAGD